MIVVRWIVRGAHAVTVVLLVRAALTGATLALGIGLACWALVLGSEALQRRSLRQLEEARGAALKAFEALDPDAREDALQAMRLAWLAAAGRHRRRRWRR